MAYEHNLNHQIPSLSLGVLYHRPSSFATRGFPATVCKCFTSKVDDENLTFILGERSQFGRVDIYRVKNLIFFGYKIILQLRNTVGMR